MTTTVERYTVEVEGLTLPRLLWRRFRAPYPGLVERILDEIPGLAALGPYLPVGTVVPVPIDRPRAADQTRVISLWD
jgi:phage tail protein X